MFKIVPVALLLALSACHAHANLLAPKESDELAQRVETYNKHKPIFIHPQESLIGLKTGEVDYLVMQNGQVIHHPEDLLPLVEADSELATEAQKAQLYQMLGKPLLAVSWIAALSSIGMLLYWSGSPGGITPVMLGPVPFSPVFMAFNLGGVAIGLGGGIFTQIGQGHQRKAFENFDAALQKKLHLCPDEEDWQACPNQE